MTSTTDKPTGRRPFRVRVAAGHYSCPGCGHESGNLAPFAAAVFAHRHARRCLMLEVLNRNPWVWGETR